MLTLGEVRNNYNRLSNEARKRGEKFSIFDYKKRKLSPEKLEYGKRLVLLNNNKTYRKKRRWLKKFRPIIARKLQTIRTRCISKGCNKYKYYGGRGIKCLLKMNDLEFLYHRDNAASMLQPSIDRIDPDKNYEINNCRFIEMSENRASRRKNS